MWLVHLYDSAACGLCSSLMQLFHVYDGAVRSLCRSLVQLVHVFVDTAWGLCSSLMHVMVVQNLCLLVPVEIAVEAEAAPGSALWLMILAPTTDCSCYSACDNADKNKCDKAARG